MSNEPNQPGDNQSDLDHQLPDADLGGGSVADAEVDLEADGEPAAPPQQLSRRKVLQGLAGGAVVAGGIAITANGATGPLTEAGGPTTTRGPGVDSSATSAGGANPTLRVGEGPTSSGTLADGQTIAADGTVTSSSPGTGTVAATDSTAGPGTVSATDSTAGVDGVGPGMTGGEAPTEPSVVDAPAPTSPTTVDPPISGQEELRGADIGTAAPVEQRVLVLIELQGGSDGLSLVVPDDANYRRNRTGDLLISPSEYQPLSGGVGLHPSLAQLPTSSIFNVATVEGVGPIDGNLSHFKMAASWERGDVRSAKLVSSGFCGRVADAVNLTNGFAGVSVAGRTGYFDGGRVPALVMSEASELDVVTGSAQAGFRRAAQGFTNPIGANWVKLEEMGAKLNSGLRNPPDNTMIRRGKELGKQLYLAAQLIKADIGVKVLYANLGSFDTHDNQERRLRFLWEEFDYAVTGFFEMLKAAGMANRALVATTSEFGRRLKQNARGTDHGSASNLIMVGPIQQRRYGSYPSLTNLDSDGNLKTEVPFDQYYATLCKDWMGVEPSLVLPGDPRPLGLA